MGVAGVWVAGVRVAGVYLRVGCGVGGVKGRRGVVGWGSE